MHLKLRLLALFALIIMLFTCAIASAEVVGVTAEATMETPYHQVTTVFVEYSESVTTPDADTYRIMDFALSNMKEDYESRPYDEGVITAVYTNNKAERREDKTSAEGNYVVIELAGTDGSYFDEAEQLWKPKNIAGIATTRFSGESKQHTRTDWSLFTVIQLKDVLNTEGSVVAARGVLPAMPNGPIHTPEIEAAFTQMYLPASNGKYDILYNLHLPEDYDPAKTYPMIIVESGGGGGMIVDQLHEDGTYACLGADITLDAVAISFVRAEKNLIVAAFQRWDTCPGEWEVDNVQSVIELNEYLRTTYSVDPQRVYALGSSAGTANFSEAIQRRPDLWNGYVQCNGSYVYYDAEDKQQRFTLYKPEFMKNYVNYTDDMIWSICMNEENTLDKDIIAETGKCFDPIIENRIPVYFFDGVNAESGGSKILNTISDYLYLKEQYEKLGLSVEEISELLRIQVCNNYEFHIYGICEYHASSKLAVTQSHDIIDWILSR